MFWSYIVDNKNIDILGLIEKNSDRLKNVAQRLFEDGEIISFTQKNGTFLTKYPDGKRIISKFINGQEEIIEVYHE